jgi:hypothetical protein
VNIFYYSILAIRKAGLRRFAAIVALKGSRRLFEGRIDKRLLTANPAAPAGFEGVLPLESSTAQRFKIIFPAAFLDLLACAQRIRSHRFHFLGATLQYGEKINWHLDLASTKEWQKKSYRENVLHYDGSPLDIKHVWELNRHQYFVTLAQAFYVSGDRTYADELVAQWLDWIKENPYRIGVHWASPLEIGLRLISWTLAFQFIEPHLSKENRSAITFSIWQQASFLASHLSLDKVVRTNHLIGEAAGLFVTASAFAFESSKQWMASAREILEDEIRSQVFSDGAGKEQSSSYHRFDVDLFLLAHMSGQKLSVPFSPGFKGQLQKMVRWLDRFQTPTNHLPPFGDCDNGRGFLLSPSVDFWDARGLIALGGLVMEDEELSEPSFLNEEAFWLLSEREWNSAKDKPAIARLETCVVSRESGHVAIRNADSSGIDYCFFRAGPFGMGGDGFSSHSHNDLFSPILYINGELILADTGTSVYLGNDAERDYLRSAAAHNTTFPSGWKSFESQRQFGWTKVVDGRIIREHQTNQEIMIECGFEESARIPYKRTIVYRSGEHSLRIEDLFEENVSDVHSYFHLDTKFTTQRDGREIVLMKDSNRVARFSFSDHVEPMIEEGWISKSYGIKERAAVIHFCWNAVAHQSTIFAFTGVRK